MAQNWTDTTYDPSFVIHDTEVAEMNNFACLKTSFSGDSPPGSPAPGQLWYVPSIQVLSFWDGTQFRAVATSFGSGGTTPKLKIWVYANTAVPGWVIDASVADAVIAVKGGAYSYNVDGGTVNGSWTLEAYAGDHSHHWAYFDDYSGSLRFGTYFSDGSKQWMGGTDSTSPNKYGPRYASASSGVQVIWPLSPSGNPSLYTEKSSAGTSSTSIWRPLAAVGTIQYPYSG